MAKKSAISFIYGKLPKNIRELILINLFRFRSVLPPSFLQRHYGRYLGLTNLKVADAGVDTYPYIKLTNGKIFYGALPYPFEKKMYPVLPHSTRKKIPVECIGLALHIDERYINGGEVFRYYKPKKTDTLVEVGSFFGFHTIYYSDKVKRVFSFEAAPDNFMILEKNIKSNKLDNVTIFNQAIWKEEAELPFYSSGNFQEGKSFVPGVDVPDSNYTLIKARPLNKVLNELKIKKVDFLVLQVNGAETPILESMDLSNIQNICTFALYEVDGRKSSEQVLEILDSKGFEAVNHEGIVYGWKKK